MILRWYLNDLAYEIRSIVYIRFLSPCLLGAITYFSLILLAFVSFTLIFRIC